MTDGRVLPSFKSRPRTPEDDDKIREFMASLPMVQPPPIDPTTGETWWPHEPNVD